MKKLIAIPLMMLVFTFLAAIPAVVSANSTAPLFEMQIDNTGNVLTVTDGAENSLVDVSRGIDTTVINNGPEPVYGEVTVGEITTPYLSFAHTPTGSGTTYTYQGENSGIRVPLTVNLAQKDAITMETWVRFGPHVAQDGRYHAIFGVNTTGTPGNANKAFDLRVGGTYLEAYGASDMANDLWNALGKSHVDWIEKYGYLYSITTNNAAHNATTQKYTLSNETYANKWSHIVLTRVWNDSNSDGLGTWTVTIYLDGVSVSSATYPMAGEVSKTGTAYTDLIIGKSNDTSFAGDIATFKVYDGAFDADEAYESYVSGVTMFFERVGIESLTRIGENTLALTFSNNVKADTLAGNITLKRGETTLRSSVAAIDVDENGYTTSAEITVGARMGYDETYTLCINTNVLDESGFPLKDLEREFTTDPSPYGYAQVSGSVSEGTISVSMPISGATPGDEVAAALIVMDAGRIVDFEIDSRTVEADGTANPSIAADGISVGYTVEAIVWRYDPIKGACAISKRIVAE